jgi:asparagine synthase (glutamine-hydrolysing)
MTDAAAATTVIFNGEIYNHRELRRELERSGQRFVTDHSDTEVLLKAYEFWGESMVERLDGMFAFAIWDARKRRLFLARDRFGEKPLFYLQSGDVFAFASELPSLRRYPAAAAAGINYRAIQKFFAYSFLPGRVTPYRGVAKLPPGSTLTLDLQDRHLAERRYWRFAITPDEIPPGSQDDWVEEVARLLRQAVASRLESDVPLGIFLSGGIDSSSIATLASQEIVPRRLSTFTVAFNERSYDESEYAARVARRIASLHHVEACSFEYMYNATQNILRRLGEPLGDPSLIPTYMLAAHAARHVKVALSGDGGDELFAGYDPFRALRLAKAYQALVPRPLHRGVRLLASRLPPSNINMGFAFRFDRATRALAFGAHIWNPLWLAALEPKDIARISEQPVDVDELYSEAIELWDASQADSMVDRTLEFFTNVYLPDDILVKSDRAGMMNSLEIRAPFLHQGLVDYVRRLPHQVKYRAGCTKWILKRATERILPKDIVYRPKKGFGIPVSQWLRRLAPSETEPLPFLKEEIIKQWDQEHRAHKRDHRGLLWCQLVLENTLR